MSGKRAKQQRKRAEEIVGPLGPTYARDDRTGARFLYPSVKKLSRLMRRNPGKTLTEVIHEYGRRSLNGY